MNQLLKDCISQLREVRSSGEMAPADRDQLGSVIASLEQLERDLEDERDQACRSERILQAITFVSRILAKIFLDLN